ncbi:RidA family protein [Pseudomonas sp. M30-35]|uniref:RidA family protein n=1 Tax=Pseudomonas sp. M30-35 TaxID=1981174 RepID=UPI00211570AA|nr:RidA family protein [Pseudomonas sp. M30-35]
MPSDMSSSVFTLSNPAGLYDPTDNAYSHVAQVPLNARIVHLAGQGGQDREGYLAPGFTEQVRQTIANIEIGLVSAGATLDDVYKLTLLVVDHSESRLAEWAAEAKRAWGPHLPTCTLIAVPRLALDGMLVEVEAIAALPAA